MSNSWLYRLAGLASGLGGLLSAVAHALHTGPPTDPAQLAQYAELSQPLHLVLFAGGLLVLLGWFGQFAYQSSASSIAGLVAFLFLFLGILFADLLHCVLEISVFPLLSATVPYATPGLVEATYHSTPLAAIQSGGRFLVLAGVPLAALSILESGALPWWSAAPFAITTLLMVANFVPASAVIIHSQFFMALYLSMTILGVALFRASFKKLYSATA